MLDLERLDSIVRKQCGLRRDQALLVGVSGGPDSLCLLAALHEAGWNVIAAHFNHRLRPEAAEEAAAVEAIAAQMGIPYVGSTGDVRGHAAENKMSIETAARDLRYRFLFARARERGAQAVAVGHTADDQVETVLMHFIRGAGLNGLKGMEYRTLLREYQVPSDEGNILLVRPLLDAWRLDTIAYCESRGLRPHYDASNDSMEFVRNRVRHELIPLLESYNPRFREAAWRAVKTLAIDAKVLEAALEPHWYQAFLRQGDQYAELDAEYLAGESVGVQVHVLRRAMHLVRPGAYIDFEVLQRAAALITDPGQQRTDLTADLFLLREGSSLYMAASEEGLPRDHWPQLQQSVDLIPLPIPGNIALDAGWRISSALWKVGDPDPEEPDWEEPRLCVVDLDAHTLPAQLELRIRRPGDRFRPLGMGGHSQKLSDFLTNVKMPRRARDRWPLVCAGASIVWIPGYRFDHANRSERDTDTFVVLKLRAPDSFEGDISGRRFVHRRERH